MAIKIVYREGDSQGESSSDTTRLAASRLTPNFQSHQNTYYYKAIEAFNTKLATIEDKSIILEEDKEIA
jgi:hypothetical protein